MVSIAQLAREYAWTPCVHFPSCVAVCPICWAEYVMTYLREPRGVCGCDIVTGAARPIVRLNPTCPIHKQEAHAAA